MTTDTTTASIELADKAEAWSGFVMTILVTISITAVVFLFFYVSFALIFALSGGAKR